MRVTYSLFTLNILFLFSFANSQGEEHLVLPKNLKLGTATASYQIEGAWNISDKGESVWDRYTHTKPWLITDQSTGDVACDSYHKYKEDVALLKSIGIHHYRFSLSWTRILPHGYANNVSKDGIQYYHNLIDELLANNIEPLVTIYHWDHPQVLEEMGGWTNELMIDWFTDYANIVFREFGSKVKHFVTVNEPYVVCYEGYGDVHKAPGKDLPGRGDYLCMHNVLKAHARTYHLYNDTYRATGKGSISIVIPCSGAIAKYANDTESEDVDFAFFCGWMAHPIFSKTGDYPEIMKTRIAENSKIEGCGKSRLPEFSPYWIEYIKGTADYFALNHYTTHLVESVPKVNGSTWFKESGLVKSDDPSWLSSPVTDWLKIVPEGFRKILNKLRTEYDNVPVYVLENGFSDLNVLVDTSRIEYLYSYIEAMLKAIHIDGCNVQMYTVWSLLDNFEWDRGYTERFGMVQIDFNSPNRTRTPKLSSLWYKNLIKTGKLEPLREETLKEYTAKYVHDGQMSNN